MSTTFTEASYEWTIIENSEKLPDVILFANSLPLVVAGLMLTDCRETKSCSNHVSTTCHTCFNPVSIQPQI